MTRFVVIGDATLDVTVAPSRSLRGGGDVPAVIWLGPGGQGANVAVRLARRGAAVVLATPVAADAAGRLLDEALRGDGVRLAPLPATRTAAVVALLDGGGERSMLSDRQSLRSAGVATALDGAGWIHASAYALLDDQEGDELAQLLGGRAPGTRLSIAGGSIPPDAALVRRFRARVGAARPDLVMVNRDEATALLGEPAWVARDAAARLRDLAPVVMVTAGQRGSAAALGDELSDVGAPDIPGPVLDATGSGDAYLAAVILELAGAAWPPDAATLRAAMERGSLAGAHVARVVGAQARIDGEA